MAGHSVTAPAQEYSHDGHRVGFVTGYASSGGIDSGRVYVYPEEESYWRDLKGNPSRWFVGAAGDAMPFKYVSLTPGTVVIGTAICRSGVKTGPNAGRFFKPMPIGIDTSTY